MNIIGIIPARYGSTRFEGKPLTDIGGKTMIRRVTEQALKAQKLATVAVATDDERIANEVRSFGGTVVMTSADHLNGTSRCAEAAELLGGNWDAVINIQGDEPFIHPGQIDLLAGLFEDAATEIGTLVKKLHDIADLDNPNIIKVVLDAQQRGMYFSRSPIPHLRGVESEARLEKHTFYKHIGIYGYRMEVLRNLVKLSPTPLEMAESLEQLRWRENGFTIRTALTDLETISVDVPSDIDKLRAAGLI
ncbi:MAG: 3-deoxy-manno-octulosonate cytidylyltransferase [Bacteroidia bacterium]|jgi:3-deoxy-manno-octulosonate cytidylyltransferase (CMP-KDO synthetase)|nr:3-deoxy-manno-octulosonate cytidylyltransferase [Bacteroidia bacterium]